MRTASNKQTTQNNSLFLFASLPIAPSTSNWPTFPQSLSLSLSLPLLISFSAFSAPTYTPLSVSPPHILSPSFSSPFVSVLLIVNSFIFSHPSPLSSYFPQSLWCVVGQAEALCGGNEANWRPGMSPAPSHTHTHTHTREVPLRPEGHMKEVNERQAIQAIHGFSDHSTCQRECVCVCVCVCVRVPAASMLSGQNWTMWQSDLRRPLMWPETNYSQQMWSHASHTHTVSLYHTLWVQLWPSTAV